MSAAPWAPDDVEGLRPFVVVSVTRTVATRIVYAPTMSQTVTRREPDTTYSVRRATVEDVKE